ncbi:MAG: hypothetical protein KF696_10460 [Planctomycetes bacterium]|nr:hypothetical protein [Planctomycetota bacterium]MCW8135148.1 hypothetical protein [Planctomycetota bacterium]
MRKAIPLTAVLAFALLGACKSSGGDKGSGGGNGETANCGGGTDIAAMIIKQYLDGNQKAAPWIAIHETVNVGQQWHVESDFGQGPSVDKWQIVAKPGKSEFIVEHLSGQGVVIAYQVDAWAEAGEPNVRKAWIGKEGEEPQEIKVAEWQKSTGGTKGEEPGFVMKAKFYNVEMAGKKFEGETITIKETDWSSRTWIADNGWFNKVIRMDYNDKTQMKVIAAKFDEKVDTFLKWPKPEKK